MISLDTVQSMFLIVFGFVSIAILLRILVIVHKQTRRVKELEMRMKAVEGMDAQDVIEKQAEQGEM